MQPTSQDQSTFARKTGRARSVPEADAAAGQGVSRRTLLAKGSLALAGAGLLSVGRRPGDRPGGGGELRITGIDEDRPRPGEVVTVHGSGFDADPRANCIEGLVPLSVDETGTKLTAVALAVLGTRTLTGSRLSNVRSLGEGGGPYTPIPNVAYPASSVGVVGSREPGTTHRSEVLVSVRPRARSRHLTMAADSMGRIRIDNVGAEGSTRRCLELELHATLDHGDGGRGEACDFLCTEVHLGASTASCLAAEIGLLCATHLTSNRAFSGMAFAVEEDSVYLVPPAGKRFVGLLPSSHATLT